MLIYQITDIHIPFEGQEQIRDNFLKIMAYTRQHPPDLLVITGDLSYGDQPAVCDWINEQLPGNCPYVVIPGNHDNAADLLDSFGDALVINPDFYFSIPADEIDLLFANSGSESIPPGQLAMLSATQIRPGSILFVHHPTKVLSSGYMDLTYPLKNLNEADAVISASHIEHVFCGHFHSEFEVHADYSLYVTPSPAFEINLDSPDFKPEKTRIPIRRIEIEGAEVTTSLIDLSRP